jgi:hypothetical protein
MRSSARDPPVALFAVPGIFNPGNTPSATKADVPDPPGETTELLTLKFVRPGCAEKSRYRGTGALALGMLTVLTGAKLPDTCNPLKSPAAAFSTSTGNVNVSMTDGSATCTTQVAVTVPPLGVNN